jgi:poly(3-hydroxybutyrate) depolymerase
MGLIRALIDRVTAADAINPKRVYAFGYSNGGHMAFRLAIEAPSEVAAIAALGASLPTQNSSSCSQLGEHPAPCRSMGPTIQSTLPGWRSNAVQVWQSRQSYFREGLRANIRRTERDYDRARDRAESLERQGTRPQSRS